MRDNSPIDGGGGDSYTLQLVQTGRTATVTADGGTFTDSQGGTDDTWGLAPHLPNTSCKAAFWVDGSRCW